MSNADDTTADLEAARYGLANARAILRSMEDAERIGRAMAEETAIAARCTNPETGEIDVKRLGSNEAERARALAIALFEDVNYLGMRREFREAHHTVELAQARLDHLLDRRREREYALRERVLTLLEQGGRPPSLLME